MKTDRRGIGEKLRALRKQRRLTLAVLSRRTGYSVSALSKMENERLGLTYDKLTTLAVALQVDMSSLFTEDVQQDGPQAAGRRSIARKGVGRSVSTGCEQAPNIDHLRRRAPRIKSLRRRPASKADACSQASIWFR